MRRGKRMSYGAVRVVVKKTTLGYSRLGLAVSRKYGNAVQRNRFKRQVRDIFRTGDYHRMSVDVLVVPIQRAEKTLCVTHDFQMALGRVHHK